MCKKDLAKLYKEYKNEFNFIWIENFDEAEQFEKYLVDNNFIKSNLIFKPAMICGKWGYTISEVMF